MKRYHTLALALAIALTPLSAPQSQAHENDPATATRPASTAASHAPIGVMGDHMHKTGEWMLSYRYMHMDMDGNRRGTDSVDPDTIATTLVNPFAPPATTRVVPTSMTMDMHMLGAMYAPTDWLTLMLMGMWQEKEMDHITYAGMAGTTVRGTFTTNSSGWGDTSLSGLFRLYNEAHHKVHLNLGLRAPTGSIKKSDQVLAPTGATPVLRMPYAMQLGTGTYDLLPGITYNGTDGGKWRWGAQYSAEVPLEDENDQGYRWDDKHMLTGWAIYGWQDWVSTSLRLSAKTQGGIHGRDTNIAAPVQSANPDNYGGDVIETGLGVNFLIPNGPLAGHRFAIEANLPLYRDLNGTQLETDWSLTAGWQYAF